MVYKIIGKITASETGQGLAGLRVQAWDKDIGYLDELLGEITTDKNGEFLIEYSEEQFDKWGLDEKPDIYLLVTNKKGAVIYNTEEAVKQEADKAEVFNIQISIELLNKEPDVDPDDIFSDLLKRLKE